MRVQGTSGERRGAAIAEAAVVVPFLFLLLFGIWEVGRLIQVSQVVSNASREGSRLASTGLYSSSSSSTLNGSVLPNYQVQTAVANYLSNSNLPLTASGVYITVTNETRNLTCKVQVTPTSGTVTQSTQVAVAASESSPAYDPTTDSSVQQFDMLRVDIQYRFNFARWSPNNLFFFMGPDPQVYATSRWPCMRDRPITINAGIPNRPY